MTCIFCKIANKEVPALTVYEDEGFIAFLDIAPLNPGHVQVIPKRHYRWVWDVPDIGKYFGIVQKVANALRATFRTEFVVSLVIGEEVPHAHVWLVPRVPNDGHGSAIDLSLRRKLSDEEMRRVQESVRQNI